MNSSADSSDLDFNLFKRESFCINEIITDAMFSLSSLSTSYNENKNCGFVQNFD